MRGRRGGEAAWEKTQEEPGPRIFQTDWASPNPPGSAEAPGMAAAMGVLRQTPSLPETWQDRLGDRDQSGSRTLILPSRNKGLRMPGPPLLQVHSLLSPPGTLASRESTLVPQEHRASLLALSISISSLQTVSSWPILLPLWHYTCHIPATFPLGSGKLGEAGSGSYYLVPVVTWA